jgi:hypothetical protein
MKNAYKILVGMFAGKIQHGGMVDVSVAGIINYSVEIPTRCSFVIEFIISKFFKVSACFKRHTAHHQDSSCTLMFR